MRSAPVRLRDTGSTSWTSRTGSSATASTLPPWLLGAFEPGAFHPNLAGYEAYASAVTAAIQPGHSS